jgi:hypothetical protein
MSAETDAVERLDTWMASRSMKPGWERVVASNSPGYDLGLRTPHYALLLAIDGQWVLHLVTARGVRKNVLAQLTDRPDIVLDAMLFAIFTKATSELEHPDRTASAQLAAVLRVLADETHDARYSGRAAALLAGHAIKDGYELQARMRLDDAVRLFRIAGDSTAADTAADALNNLSGLMAS